MTSLRAWLPVSCLVANALFQIALAKTADLSPWKGGGFGMFAATDGSAFRRVRIVVDGPGRSQEIDIAPSLERSAARAALFPSDRRLTWLARAVTAREERYARPVCRVSIDVFRTEFSGDPLHATEHRIRSFVVPSACR